MEQLLSQQIINERNMDGESEWARFVSRQSKSGTGEESMQKSRVEITDITGFV